MNLRVRQQQFRNGGRADHAGGFIPGAVVVGAVILVGAFIEVGATCAGCVATFGEFKGAPTAISHLCPGWPCAGFIPGAVVVGGAFEYFEPVALQFAVAQYLEKALALLYCLYLKE